LEDSNSFSKQDYELIVRRVNESIVVMGSKMYLT
jgi:hypothetical protein